MNVSELLQPLINMGFTPKEALEAVEKEKERVEKEKERQRK